jgi:hypothetical protein
MIILLSFFIYILVHLTNRRSLESNTYRSTVNSSDSASNDHKSLSGSHD